MKILYAVQATGNGHISRAQSISPYLQKYGKVDIFLSGSNYALECNLPIVFRSKGFSFEYNQSLGRIDIFKTLRNFRPAQHWKDIKNLPVENYDLIINDFEPLTSLACKMKGISSIHFGHQASFKSKYVPRPEMKNFIGEFILSNYVSGSKVFGLHFKPYDSFIYPPIIKENILHAKHRDEGHITIYLAQYKLEVLVKVFSQFRNSTFHIFSNNVSNVKQEGNIRLFPIDKNMFDQSLITCHGIITGGGFETPAEALYLNKKLMVIPINGQYEQQCNAVALVRDFNVTSLTELDRFFYNSFYKWLIDSQAGKIEQVLSTEQIISELVKTVF